jgi:DNA-binding MarR family transcriptional regulator
VSDSADEPEESLSEAFWGVAGRLRRLSRERLAPWDITPSHYRALAVLRRHGTMRLSELSEHLRIAARSATEVVDALEERGLVARRPDPHDRRATLVVPTGRGTDLAATIRSAQGNETERVFERLSPTDRDHLARILRKLLD